MFQGNIRFVVLFAVGMWLTAPAEAMMPGHGHASGSVPPECRGPNVLPSLKCAQAPSAVFDAKGRLWLAWAYGGHVYVNYSDDKGISYSKPVAVNRSPESIAARAENRPKIALDKQGHVYVSWVQKLPKRFSGHVRFSRSMDGGRHFVDPVTVNDHLEVTSHRFESLAVNERGDIYLAWLDKRDKLAAKAAGRAYTGAALYYALSTDGGKSFRKNQKVMDNSCECCRTAMAIDRDSLPVILWRHIFGKNTRDHALVKFIGSVQVGEVRRVSYDHWQVDACPHHGPDISIGKDGRYHLTWFNNAPQRHGLFYAYSDDQGKSISTPLGFGNYAAAASHPQVLSFGKRVYLAWKEFDGKQSTLKTMSSSDGGQQWSAPTVIEQTEADSDHPLLISDGQRGYAAWHRRGQAYRLIPLN